MIYTGFQPYINSDSRILILGSFPSVKSREEGFYYGNKQNRFWRILAQSCDSPLPATIDEKKRLLKENGIALWDVVISCEIKGSMDKDIRNPVIADMDTLLKQYPIQHIITNGGTAQTLLQKHFPRYAERSIALPSTSPANARLNVSVWLNTLQQMISE